jgi:hypothetical protein
LIAAMATLCATSSNSSSREVSADLVFLQALARLLFGLADEVLQFEHAAGAGFERRAVGAVHGAEADMLELVALLHNRLSRRRGRLARSDRLGVGRRNKE